MNNPKHLEQGDVSSWLGSLSDEDFDHVSAMDEQEARNEMIRRNAHIVNGGEELVECPACKGTGRWGWSNRPCFKCNSTGKTTKAKAAQHKGVKTQQANFVTWLGENDALVQRMRRHSWHRFVASITASTIDSQRIPSAAQLDSLTDCLNRLDLQEEARRQAAESDRLAKGGQLDMSKIHAMFDRAKGAYRKRLPKFRTKDLLIKPARRHEDVLYVLDHADRYCGKITRDGQFHASNKAPDDTITQLRLVCDDPNAAIKSYAHHTGTFDAAGNLITGTCGICMKELSDPISLERGVGPICAQNFGF